jgi:cytoskeletal protein RodZ
MMLRYLVFLIFTAALLGLSANPTVVHAQTNEQATEPDQATQSDEKNESDQAASPDDSTQTDQSEDSDQPADESGQPVGTEDAGPQDQDQ